MNKRIHSSQLFAGDTFHPGEFIKEEIISRRIKQTELAQDLGISMEVMNHIICAKRNITLTLAMRLEAILKIDAEVWMNLQAIYDHRKVQALDEVIRPSTAHSKPPDTKPY